MTSSLITDRRSVVGLAIIFSLLALLAVHSLTACASDTENVKEVENLTLVIHPDGTLEIKGAFEGEGPVKPEKGVQVTDGAGFFGLEATPTKVEGGYDWDIKASGEGHLILFNETSWSKLYINLESDSKGASGTAKILFDVQGKKASGKGTVNLDSSANGRTVTISINFDIDIQASMSTEDAAQLKKQLKSLTPDVLNLAMSQQGITFLKFNKIDLSDLSITENGVKGTGAVEMEINYDDYISWYKGMLIMTRANETEINETEIEEKVKTLEAMINASLSGKSTSHISFTLDLEGKSVEFNFDLTAHVPAEVINGIRVLLSEAGEETPFGAGGIGASEAKIIAEEVPIKLSEKLTLAPKPLRLKVVFDVKNSIAKVEARFTGFIKGVDTTSDYKGALQTLKYLASTMKGNETLDHVVVEVAPKDNVAPAIKIVGTPHGSVEAKGNVVVLKDVLPGDLDLLELSTPITVTPPSTTTTTTTITTSTPAKTTTTTTPPATTTTTQPPATTTSPAKGVSKTLVAGIVVAVIVVAVAALAFTRK